MGRGLRIELTRRRHRGQLEELLSGGLQPVRTVLRALALRQMDAGRPTPAVGANLGLSAKAVWQIGKRYLEGGLERALFDAARPGKAQALDPEQRQRIIAVACSKPRRPGAVDGAHAGPKPRLKTVAGKKCGAWPSSMRNTSRAWRMCWPSTKSRSRNWTGG